jgi:hypothetical protein
MTETSDRGSVSRWQTTLLSAGGMIVVLWGVVMASSSFDQGVAAGASGQRPVLLGAAWMILGSIAIGSMLPVRRSPRGTRIAAVTLLLAGLSVTLLPGGSYYRVPPAWPRGTKSQVPPGYLWLTVSAIALTYVGAVALASTGAVRARPKRPRPGTWILSVLALGFAGLALWTGWLYRYLAPPTERTVLGDWYANQDSNLGFHRFIAFIAVVFTVSAGASLGRRLARRRAAPIEESAG